MPALQQKKNYETPTKGRDDRYSPLMIDADEAAELKNFVVNQRGILDKVQGYQTDGSPFPNSTDSFIRMLINYRKGTSVDKLIMAAQDSGNANTTYKVDLKATSGDGTYQYIGYTVGTATFTNGSANVTGSGTAWSTNLKAGDKIKPNATSNWYEIQSITNDTALVLVSTFAESTQTTAAYMARIILNKSFVPRAAVFNNACVISNGSEKMMSYDNTTITLITNANAPAAKYLEPHKARLFAANTSANPSNIYWSYSNDHTTWDAAGAEPIFPNDNGQIVATKSFADSLIVFKNNGKIYQVVGDFGSDVVSQPDFIRRLDTPDNIGNISDGSVVIHTDGIYFLASTGIYRLDYRLYLTKMSYPIQNFVSSVNLALGPSQNKAYVYDTQTQWNSGTFDGTYADSGGTLYNHYASKHIVDSNIGGTTAFAHAVTIDSNNSVHAVYVTGTKIIFVKWDVDGTTTTETAVTETQSIVSLSIKVKGSTTGVLYGTTASGGLDPALKYTERTAPSTWSATTTIYTATGRGGVAGSFTYLGSDIRSVFAVDASSSTGNLMWAKRVSGTWSTGTVASGLAGLSYYFPFITLNGSNNPRVSVGGANGGNVYLYAYYSDNDMSSWTGFTSLTLSAGATPINVADIQVGADGKAYSAYTDPTGVVKKRNWTDATSSTLDSATNSNAYGYKLLAISGTSYDYLYNILGVGSTAQTEKFIFGVSATSVSSSSEGVRNPGVSESAGQWFDNNSHTFACAIWGTSTNELVLRRISLDGTWQSPETSDSSLTAWGTYAVVGQVNNGNTVLEQITVDSVPGSNTWTTISNGNLISSDPSKVYIKTKVTFTLGAFSQSQIGSITLNYTGAGVDAKQPFGVSFNNEMYLACSQSVDASNDFIILYDLDNTWALLTHPVSTMCWYRGKLYAGLSTQGDLVILRQTYRFGANAYSCDFQSKEDFLDAIDVDKDIFKIYVLYEVKAAGSFTFSYRLDNFKSATPVTWTDTTVDQTKNGIQEILVGNKARTIQFRVQDSNLDDQCSVIGWVVVYGYLNQR